MKTCSVKEGDQADKGAGHSEEVTYCMFIIVVIT